MVVGFALFGALTYLPLFQQVVRGLSPDRVGAAAAARDGRPADLLDRLGPGHHAHRALQGVADRRHGGRGARACGCCRRWTSRPSTGVAALHMLVLGLGLGMVMQVLVLAVQNAVPYEQLGVATSGATLFRSIGGSLGTAVLGAIFAGRLTAELPAPAAGDRRRPRSVAIERLPAPSTTPTSRPSPTRCRSSSSSPRWSWWSRSCCRGSSRSGRCGRRSRRGSARRSAGRSTPTRCARSRVG